MQALPADMTPTPFYLEEGTSSISLKAKIEGKSGELKAVNICLFNKAGQKNWKANAEYVLRACNHFENALELASYIWEARQGLADSGTEGAMKSEELEVYIESAREIAHPGIAGGKRFPRAVERFGQLPRTQFQKSEQPGHIPGATPQPPTPAPALDKDGLPPPIPDEELLQVTPRKIAQWGKDLKSPDVHKTGIFDLPMEFPDLEDEDAKK